MTKTKPDTNEQRNYDKETTQTSFFVAVAGVVVAGSVARQDGVQFNRIEYSVHK